MDQITILMLAALVVMVVGYFVYYFRVNRWNPQGTGAERITRKILVRFGSLRKQQVLSSVLLTDKSGKSDTIDNMLIGPFGILLVQTLGAMGEYYGEPDKDTWVRVLDGQRTTLENPLKVQERQMVALRALFSANGIYNVPIEKAVHITSTAGKTGVFIKGARLFQGRKLRAFLSKPLFEKDNGVDPQKIVSLLKA